MLKMSIFLFLAIAATAFGDVADHFKSAGDKSGNHSMRNIDFIYTINLDRRPEKFASCTEQLHPYGIDPFRFSAVNGWELTLEDINDVGVKFDGGMRGGFWGTSYLPNGTGEPFHSIIGVPGQTYFCHCMARGPIGIVLSHLSVLQDAYDSGYDTIWVMEDDIQVIRDPHLISDYIDKLDARVGRDNWDMLFTDQDTKNQKGEYIPCRGFALRPNFAPAYLDKFSRRQDLDQDFRKVGARYGAYSVIVRRSGMEKILNFIKKYKIFLPYDMDFIFPKGMKMYVLKDEVVSTQPNALSDNGAPNYRQNL
jgi:GR25 family glycosyltransferase involved in LPS biosynthesis